MKQKKRVAYIWKLAYDILDKYGYSWQTTENMYSQLMSIKTAITKDRLYLTSTEFRNTDYGSSRKVNMGYISNNKYYKVSDVILRYFGASKKARLVNEYDTQFLTRITNTLFNGKYIRQYNPLTVI